MVYRDFVLAVSSSGSEARWVVKEDTEVFRIHFLCRPALQSVLATMREIQRLRDRRVESQAGIPQSRREYFGVITCNPDYERIFQSQSLLYIAADPATLALPWEE